MSKKSKQIDEPENYEVWVLYATDGWKRVEEGNNGGVFASRNRALLLAESKSHGEEVVETMVISRRPIATFNGEAISLKHKLKLPEEWKKDEGDVEVVGKTQKKEETNGGSVVHSDGPEAGHVAEASPEHSGQAAPGGAGREGAPPG